MIHPTHNPFSLTLLHKRAPLFWGILFGVFCVLFYLLQGMLMPFVAGFLIAYIFNPLVQKAEQCHLPRALGSSLIIGTFILLILIFLFVTIPFVKSELLFLLGHFPEYGQHVLKKIEPFFKNFSQYVSVEEFESLKKMATGSLGQILSWFLTFLGTVFTSGLALANILAFIFVAPVVAFYLLKDWQILLAKFDALIPRNQVTRFRFFFREIDKTLGGYARGQLLVCVILALYYSTALAFTGLDSAFIIGTLTGLLAFVPYVGFLTSLLIALILGAIQFTTWGGIGLIGLVYAGGQFLETFFLTPKFVGGHTGLHPVWIMFALFAGGVLSGFTGVLLALPVAAVLGVCVRFMIQAYLDSSLYNSKIPKSDA
ncbi:MAG: AI-2E family transporter [Alphaproteobacteria bacterium]